MHKPFTPLLFFVITGCFFVRGQEIERFSDKYAYFVIKHRLFESQKFADSINFGNSQVKREWVSVDPPQSFDTLVPTFPPPLPPKRQGGNEESHIHFFVYPDYFVFYQIWDLFKKGYNFLRWGEPYPKN